MITEQAFQDAAKALGCEVNAIKAVAQVEAPGGGFMGNGWPKILFEAHKFSKFTKGVYDKTHPNLSSPSWNKKLYSKSGIGEHNRLNEAVKLTRAAALKSASWGKFQILGANFVACGFQSVQDFVTAMYKDENEHLKAFVNFVKSEGLAIFLRTRNWAKFADGYNGPAYKVNKYDTKMANAFNELEGASHG